MNTVSFTDTQHDIALSIRNVSHWFGTGKKRAPVLCRVDLQIGRGQIVGLVGPSGCGKSTLLNTILGTQLAREGQIVVCGRTEGDVVVSGPGRDRGIVYQRYTLTPNLTAIENVAMGLQWDRTTLPDRIFRPFRQRRLWKEWKEQAEELLTKVGLKKALDKYPGQLSGGMCQRVAIARALIMKPPVLLMDEPFGALDEASRESMQRIVLALYGENLAAIKANKPPPYTIIVVTHEINEALYLGDRIVGLSQNWNWQEGLRLPSGERVTFDRPPGATVIYDAPAPVHDAEGHRDFETLREQREEIHRIVINNKPETLVTPGEYITFWDRVNTGACGEPRSPISNAKE